MTPTTRTIFRADAIFDSAFGVLLLLAPWVGDVFNALDLPNPEPEIYTQMAGGLLLMCGYLLRAATRIPAVAKTVALAVGGINVLAIPLLLGWVFSGELGTGALGDVILIVVSALLAMFAFAELRYATRGTQ